MGVCQGPDLLGSLMSSLYSSDPQLLPWSVGLMTAAQERGWGAPWNGVKHECVLENENLPKHQKL